MDKNDTNTSVDNFDYYLNNYPGNLFEYYLISATVNADVISDEDINQGKIAVRKLINYIKERRLGDNGRFKDYLAITYAIVGEGNEIAKCNIDLNKEDDIKEDCFKKDRKGLYLK